MWLTDIIANGLTMHSPQPWSKDQFLKIHIPSHIKYLLSVYCVKAPAASWWTEKMLHLPKQPGGKGRRGNRKLCYSETSTMPECHGTDRMTVTAGPGTLGVFAQVWTNISPSPFYFILTTGYLLDTVLKVQQSLLCTPETLSRGSFTNMEVQRIFFHS